MAYLNEFNTLSKRLFSETFKISLNCAIPSLKEQENRNKKKKGTTWSFALV